MATSGSGDLNAWNGSYDITLHFSWSRDGNGVVSWTVVIPKIDDTFSPCWTNFYIRGGEGSSARGDLTGNLVSYCASCSQCAAYYQGNILWDQTQSGTINMGQDGGTLRLGFYGVRNSGNEEENYLTWSVDPVAWTATLKYDANGGSGAPANQTASVPAATTSKDFTVSSTAPTWGQFLFLGWSTVKHTESCLPSDVEYVGGDTFTIQKSNPTRTLYAVWMKDYRPGAVLTSNEWKSTNRTDGKCHIKQNGSWVEMRTIDGGSGEGNPPSRRTSGAWKNQYRIGSY